MPETIGFRLDKEADELFREKASCVGLSAGEFAKKLALACIRESDELPRLREKLLEVEANVAELRVDLRTAVTALLVHAGKLQLDKANSWVEANLVTKD
jgi:hypothetical protein